MTIVAMDEARRREPKASYQISDHVFSPVMGFWKEQWITYRRKHDTRDSAVSPHCSDSNESRNECHAGGSCSNEVEHKNKIGSTLHGVYTVLNRRWPAQICKIDARLELVLNNSCRVKVKEGSLIGAVGDVF